MGQIESKKRLSADFITISLLVVPHTAVAEVSKIGDL